MQCPYFTVINYSTFDSSVSNYKKFAQRITAYEFEFYTEDNSGGLIINGKRHQAKKGCFTCTKPGQLQQMVPHYKCYFFNLCTQDESLCAFLDSLPDFSVLWNMDEVISVFREMLTIESTGILGNRMQLEGCICRILSLIARSRPFATEKGQDNALLHRKQLQLANQYIQEHYAEGVCLETLAAQFNLHPNYFHRLYTTAFGMTPAQKLLSCRIAAAKMILLTENCSMAEIAARCGFSSQTYFGYRFKEVTGSTPVQYRKRMLSRR